MSRSPEEHARQWLDEHGAALEMRVASQMQVTPSEVQHSGYYRDAKTGTLREFDVHAVFRRNGARINQRVEIHAVIECKATDSPWVLFMASQTFGTRDFDFEQHFRTLSHSGQTVRNLRSFGFAPALRTGGELHAYQVAETATKNDAAYAGTQQVLDAVDGIRAQHIDADADVPDSAPGIRVYVPVVVTTAPLFQAQLSADGQVNLNVTNIAPFFAQRGRADGLTTSLVWIVQDGAVDRMVEKLMDSIGMLALESAEA